MQKVNEGRSWLKQRILTVAEIAPKAASSSSSSSKEILRAEQEESERLRMKVAFKEGGKAVGRCRRTSSKNMTAMDFRAIVASDEARAFRRGACNTKEQGSGDVIYGEKREINPQQVILQMKNQVVEVRKDLHHLHC